MEREHDFIKSSWNTGEGRQVKHQPVKGNWLACAIFCKHSTTGSWYSPKKELQKLNVNPFFPDGVWCHIDRQTNTNYYCQNNLCMPEAQRADLPWMVYIIIFIVKI